MDFDLVAGLGSSVLTRAKCLGIESVSLLSGVPNMFGVKNFGPSIEKASSKKSISSQVSRGGMLKEQ